MSSTCSFMSRAATVLRELEDAVGQGRLAVVDVRDDREVADVVEDGHVVNGSATGGGARRGPSTAGKPLRAGPQSTCAGLPPQPPW